LRQWHDGYGDCDVSPGEPECLCCHKLWGEGYCQFLGLDLDLIKQKAHKTLNIHECNYCENNPNSQAYRDFHKRNPKFTEACLFKCGFKSDWKMPDPKTRAARCPGQVKLFSEPSEV
jgi:hypothetical protein